MLHSKVDDGSLTCGCVHKLSDRQGYGNVRGAAWLLLRLRHADLLCHVCATDARPDPPRCRRSSLNRVDCRAPGYISPSPRSHCMVKPYQLGMRRQTCRLPARVPATFAESNARQSRLLGPDRAPKTAHEHES